MDHIRDISKGELSITVDLPSLAGLTCTEDTGPQKSHLLAPAAQHGIAIVFPDTSPRGAKIEGEDADWDFGTGAGFYLNASSEKWSGHYNMEKFVVEELRGIVQSELSVVRRVILLKRSLSISDLTVCDLCPQQDPERTSIFGHSMGGEPFRPCLSTQPTSS
jgi:S-formylglutathione hydrolase FrmB